MMDLILHNYIEQKGRYSQMRGPLMIGGIMQTRRLLVRSDSYWSDPRNGSADFVKTHGRTSLGLLRSGQTEP
jgi:hypothetical protein